MHEILEEAAYYDYWFVYRPTEDFQKLLESTPGLKKISETGKSSLWKNEAAKAFNPPLN